MNMIRNDIERALDRAVDAYDRRGSLNDNITHKENGIMTTMHTTSADAIKATIERIDQASGLNRHVFSIDQMIKIPTPQLARYAFELNRALHDEFTTESLWLAHWSGQRRRYGLSVPADLVDSLTRQASQEWNETPSIQEEFSLGGLGAYQSFLRAEAMGKVRIAKGR